MKLNNLIQNLGFKKIGNINLKADIKNIVFDSRKTKHGDLFVAVKGVKADGAKFIGDAMARGALTFVSQDKLVLKNKEEGYLKTKNCRIAILGLAKNFFRNPQKKIKLVGITGTNGKTTITYIIESILRNAHTSCGVIGTINCRFKNKIIPSSNTTPSPMDVYSLLNQMRDKKVRYCAIEVTSHALKQDRVDPKDFSYVIFTNITQDHLDYHKDINSYFLAKLRLFSGVSSRGTAIVNADDKYSSRIINMTKAHVITYGIRNKVDLSASSIKLSANASTFTVNFKNMSFQVSTNLPGIYNVYNMLAAIAFCIKEKIPISIIQKALSKVTVPGRLERVECFKETFRIFVDFAHTEDALKNVCTALREIVKNRLIVVFGCGGDRDKTKRPRMGKVATELADFVFITSDNPRSENPVDIIKDIKKGITKDNFHIEIDRKLAIMKAISKAVEGDIVLIAGKGHEKCQIFKDKVVEFDDRKVIKECLKLLK